LMKVDPSALASLWNTEFSMQSAMVLGRTL